MNIQPVDSNTVAAAHQNGVDATFVPDNATIQKTTEQIAPLLRGGVEVTTVKGDHGDAARDVEIPELDKALNGGAEDLERLIAYLMLESDEEQVAESKTRLETMLEKMDSEQQEVLRKLNESLEEMKKQEEAQKKSEILGWLMTALSVIACALTVVMTCGAATPLAVAGCVLTCATTALSLTNQILNATGAREKHCEKRAEEMMKEDPKLTKKEALEKANKEWDMGWGIAQAILAVASLGVGIANIAKGGAQLAALTKKLAEAGKEVGKLGTQSVQYALRLASTAVQLATAGTSIGQTVVAFDSAKLIKEQAEAQADLMEAQNFLDAIKEAIEEEEELLAQLLAQIQDVYAFISEILGGQNQSVDAILDQMAPTV